MRTVGAAGRVLAAAGLLVGGAFAQTRDPQALYEDLFGQEARQVAASRDLKDDAEFAAKLLSASEKVTGETAFKAILFEKAYEFGLRAPPGYATAVAAVEQLKKLSADREDDCNEKLLAVYQLQFKAAKTDDEKAKAGELLMDLLLGMAEDRVRAGDSGKTNGYIRQVQAVASGFKSQQKDFLLARLKTITVHLGYAQQAEQLKARLQADPADKATAEKLFKVFLVELDNPVEASKYADALEDEATKRLVLVAAMKMEKLPEAACLALGQWYKDLAETAAPVNKPVMLDRAKTYLERFLKTHADADLARTKADLLLEQVQKELDKLGGQRTVDLLRLIDPAKDAIRGEWSFKDGALLSDITATARIRIPYQPPEEYDIEVVFMRRSAGDCVTILLSKGDKQFTFGLGHYSNRRYGFELVDGRNALDDRVAVNGSVRTGQKYVMRVQVRNDEIRALVDGKPILQLKMDYTKVALHHAWGIADPRSLGLGSNGGETVFYSAQLREVRGRGKPYRTPPPPPEPPKPE